MFQNISYISSLSAPSPPSGVSMSQTGLTSIQVSWISRDPNVTGYIIYYQQQHAGERLSLNAEANDTNITITELIAGAEYSIGVVATSSTLPSNETTAPDTITIGSYKQC